MKKIIALFLTFILSASLLVGCKKETEVTPDAYPETTAAEVDVVTTASIVDNGEALVKALSTEGTWIAAVLNDITLTEDLVVEGEFKNKDVITRKIALYAQDADRNVTASYTLTAPKMIVKSENTKIQNGTFVGDVYVEAKGFTLAAATVTGNVYFTSQELMDSAVIDEKSKISGVKEVK